MICVFLQVQLQVSLLWLFVMCDLCIFTGSASGIFTVAFCDV